MLHIDLLQVYKEVSYTCEELFDEAICWWRNRYFNCCESFSLQKSEYGLCYSFNSVLNIEGYEKLVRHYTLEKDRFFKIISTFFSIILQIILGELLNLLIGVVCELT